MPKTEIFLQLLIFGMSSLTVALIVVRIFPNNLLNFHKSISYKDNNPISGVIPAQNESTKSAKIFNVVQPPTFISIQSLGLKLPISLGVIKNNQWTLYDDAVSWLSTSKTPGKGNVILYAHNKEQLFASLKKINIGDEIEINAGDKKFTYLVSQKTKVIPTDVDAVLSDKNQLTLYTCDGTFDQKRLIVVAIAKTNP